MKICRICDVALGQCSGFAEIKIKARMMVQCMPNSVGSTLVLLHMAT